MLKINYSIDLEHLPKRGSKIDWKNSIGIKVPFTYGEHSGEFIIINYESPKVEIEYNEITLKMTTSDLKKGMIGGFFKVRCKDYRYKIGEVIEKEFENFIIINRELRQNTQQTYVKWYEIECLKCHNTKWIIESRIKKFKGCSHCNSKCSHFTLTENITTTDSWMIPYFLGGYDEAKQYKAESHEKVIFKCPYCGKVMDKTIPIKELHEYHSIGCACEGKMSMPERVMYSVLTAAKVKFQTQLTKTTFEWIQNYKYDFYIPSLNCIIETHGRQHYVNCEIMKCDASEQQQIDIKKKQLALSNGIEHYFEINCSNARPKNILQNIQNSGLANLLGIDINNISFNENYFNKDQENLLILKDFLRDNPNASKRQMMLALGLSINDYYQINKLLDIIS